MSHTIVYLLNSFVLISRHLLVFTFDSDHIVPGTKTQYLSASLIRSLQFVPVLFSFVIGLRTLFIFVTVYRYCFGRTSLSVNAKGRRARKKYVWEWTKMHASSL